VLITDQMGGTTIDYYVCHCSIDQRWNVTAGIDAYRCAGYQILTVEAWGAPPARFSTALEQARRAMPGQFPDPAWAFYISLVRTKDEEASNQRGGVFGKIEVYRIP
jgi:hypothetical protein